MFLYNGMVSIGQVLRLSVLRDRWDGRFISSETIVRRYSISHSPPLVNFI